jgi:hypothetical protein
MNQRPENELLSAYLDGELTAAEQAEVERWLAGDAKARRLLDELRALGHTLQSLPQARLGRDLSEDVLRAAQRKIVTGEADSPGRSADAPAPLRKSWRERLTSRAVLWPAAAVVVALLLVLNDPRGFLARWNREVAVAPPAAREDENLAEALRADRPAGPPPSIQAADAPRPATSQPEAKPESTFRAKDQADAAYATTEGGEPMRKSAPATPPGVNAPKGAPAPLPAEPLTMTGGAGMALAETKGDADFGRLRAEMDHLAGGVAGRKGAVGGGRGPGGRLAAGAAGAGAEAPPADVAKVAELGKQATATAVARANDGVLVVYCDVSPAALRTQAFDKLLVANGVAWAETDGPAAANEKKKSAEAEGRADDNRTAGEPFGATRGAVRRQADLHDAPRLPAGSNEAAGLDLVYVEAPREQVEGVLASLAEQYDNYYSVAVEPAPGADEQQPLVQYNRRALESQGKAQDKSLPGERALAEETLADPAADTKLRLEQQHSDNGVARRLNVWGGKQERLRELARQPEAAAARPAPVQAAPSAGKPAATYQAGQPSRPGDVADAMQTKPPAKEESAGVQRSPPSPPAAPKPPPVTRDSPGKPLAAKAAAGPSPKNGSRADRPIAADDVVQQRAVPAARYRVLFVLRAVGAEGGHPPVEASVEPAKPARE